MSDQEQYRAQTQVLADVLDEHFNGDAKAGNRQTGFVLLVFPFHDREGRCNYISNANREDVVTLLKEQLAHFSGAPDVSGRA